VCKYDINHFGDGRGSHILVYWVRPIFELIIKGMMFIEDKSNINNLTFKTWCLRGFLNFCIRG
jgi:hypothetical protein